MLTVVDVSARVRASSARGAQLGARRLLRAAPRDLLRRAGAVRRRRPRRDRRRTRSRRSSCLAAGGTPDRGGGRGAHLGGSARRLVGRRGSASIRTSAPSARVGATGWSRPPSARARALGRAPLSRARAARERAVLPPAALADARGDRAARPPASPDGSRPTSPTDPPDADARVGGYRSASRLTRLPRRGVDDAAELARALRSSAAASQHKRDIQAACAPLAARAQRRRGARARCAIGDDSAAIPDGDGYLLFAVEGMWPELVATRAVLRRLLRA